MQNYQPSQATKKLFNSAYPLSVLLGLILQGIQEMTAPNVFLFVGPCPFHPNLLEGIFYQRTSETSFSAGCRLSFRSLVAFWNDKNIMVMGDKMELASHRPLC